MKQLKLNTEHNKFRLRIHAVVLLVIILASLAIGFTAGQQGIPGLTGSAVLEDNCISQNDFQYFVDQANEVRADYDKCVKDLWTLQFAIKMGGKVVPSANLNATK